MRLLALLLVCGFPLGAGAQQRADSGFVPPVSAPAFREGEGPIVLLDEGHHNFHTLDGRYLAFGRLLRRDGFVVRPHRGPFRADRLGNAPILVIANALADTGDWALPARPALTPEEVAEVVAWVRSGGALLLIADHMPFPGAAAPLAEALGLAFYDGFAFEMPGRQGRLVFRRAGGGLAQDPITAGRGPEERVDSVVSFTGQAFRPRSLVRPLLIVDSTVAVLLPTRAWEFPPETPRVSAGGLLQGAAFRHGRGRVAVFGEAAMFSAQLAGPDGLPMGMNDPAAAGNPQFLLNVMRWLAGILEPDPGPG